MVNWYDCNNIVHAQVERRLNNFQITGSKPVLESYRRAVDHHHFLGAADKAVEVGYKKVSGPVRLAEQDEIRLFLKSYDPTLKVYFRVDDQIVHASADPLSWYVTSEQLASKPTGELDVVVFDSKDRYVTESSISYTLVKTDEN